MKNTLIIADDKNLLISLVKFLKEIYKFNCKFFTYENLGLLVKSDISEAKIIILELFREIKDKLRAEGIVIADSINLEGKKLLIFSGDIFGDEIDSPIYWDVGSKESFKEKIDKILKMEEIDFGKEIQKLKRSFKEFLTEPRHH